MQRTISINIDDELSKAVAKIGRERASDLLLVLPSNSRLFSDLPKVQRLAEQATSLGKTLSVLTRDVRAQEFARQVGFGVQQVASLPKTRPAQQAVQQTRPAPSVKLAAKPSPQQPPTPATLNIPEIQIIPERVVPEFIMPEAQINQPEHINKIIPKKNRVWLKTSIVAIIILGLLAVFVYPSADISVYARTQPLTRDIQVTVDKNITAPNVQQLTLPGTVINSDEQFSQQFTAKGQLNIGTKAQGLVQIYNFTGKTLKLGQDTTILIAGQNVYHFVSTVLGIKPTRYIAGTQSIDPNSLIAPVQIIADQGGDNYNLPGGTRFEIKNNILGDNPTQLYAQNPNPIDGGTTRLSSFVSQDDLNSAIQSIKQDLMNSIKQQLLSQQGLTLIDSGANLQVTAVNFDHKVNDQAQTFNGMITGHLTGLAYKAGQLQAMLEQRINMTLDSGQYLLTDQKENITPKFTSLNAVQGTGILGAHFETLVSSHIDTTGIAEKIAGKSPSDVKELLLSDPNIDSVNIKLNPSWMPTVPRFSARLHISAQPAAAQS